MRDTLPADARLPGVLVPAALTAAADKFGGQLYGDCLAGDLVIRDGRAAGLNRHGSARAAGCCPSSPSRMCISTNATPLTGCRGSAAGWGMQSPHRRRTAGYGQPKTSAGARGAGCRSWCWQAVPQCARTSIGLPARTRRQHH